jgi:hypothetical protein
VVFLEKTKRLVKHLFLKGLQPKTPKNHSYFCVTQKKPQIIASLTLALALTFYYSEMTLTLG